MVEVISNMLCTETLLKIVIALGLSFIIGIEREIKKKPMGFKTNAVIATFSCLLTVISIEAAYLVPSRNDINVTMDPLRLAAQIVSGVGFLGAGAILRKDNDNITGLTTAAMIWGAAGIGIAVGAGFYIEAAFTVISVMLVIEVLAPIFVKLGPVRLRQQDTCIVFTLNESKDIDTLMQHLKQEKIKVTNLHIKQVSIDNEMKHKLFVRVAIVRKKSTHALYQELINLPYVYSVEINFTH